MRFLNAIEAIDTVQKFCGSQLISYGGYGILGGRAEYRVLGPLGTSRVDGQVLG